MKQFEIRRLRSTRNNKRLVVILQSSFTDVFDTVVVAPLARPTDIPPLQRLRPRTRVGDQEMIIVVERLAALDRSEIGEVVEWADDVRDEITRALDLLFTGF